MPCTKVIPFFVHAWPAGRTPAAAYGILARITRGAAGSDFGKQDPQTLAFGAAGRTIDYYLIYGPSVHHVVERVISGISPESRPSRRHGL